jgi:hypothetical protein
MASTSNILAGMLVVGSGSIPSNTTVSGVTAEYVYLSNNTTGTILSGTSLTFTYTPLTIGIKVGDTINIASSTITNLDGSWPVVGATFNATSFTVRTDANVTANPIDAIGGTISIDNSLVIKNRNVIFGSAEASTSPVGAILKGETGIGTDTPGGDITIQGGLSTGNATGGSIILKTGAVSTTSDFEQTSTTRLTINTSGKAQFTGEVGVATTLSTTQTTVNLLDTTATTINMGGAATVVEIGAATGTTTVHNNVDIDLDLNVDGGDITTNATTFNLLNTNATTLNVGGAATTLNMGNASGTVNIAGNLTVNGTTTTINSTTVSVDDKNIELGSVASPNDTTADGGGITLKGATDKTLNWVNSTAAWTSSENFDLASGKVYRINNASVLSSTTLGSGVVNSSLQQVGTIGTGIWQGTIVDPTYGGTGINNGSKTITLGGNLTTSGAFNTTLTVTGDTTLTLPTSGTLPVTGSPLSQFASTTSAQLAGVISDETGSGALVFATNPSFSTGINAATSTIGLLDTTATIINMGGAATAIAIGAATGTTTVHNNLDVDLDLNVDGGDITTTAATFNLLNTNATTVNAFGAATSVTVGATTGTLALRNPTVNLSGNLFVNGNTLDTDETGIFNLLKDNATTLAMAQAATEIVIGETKAAAELAGDLGEMVVRLDLRTNADMYIDGDLFVSQINNTPIGNVTPSSGAFTTLAANNFVTFTDATNATGATFAGGSAAVKITGGLYVALDIRADNFIGDMSAAFLTSGTVADARIASSSITQHQADITGTGILNSGSINTGFGNINIGTSIFSGNGSGLTTLNASNLSSGTVADARIAATSITQHQASITGTGILNSGSITSGFGNIDIGTDTFTGNGSGLTTLNGSNISSGTVAGGRLGGNQSMAGVKTFSDTSAATTTATGAVRVSGGMGVAGDLYAGSLNTVNGAGIQALSANNLSTGTVPNGRITGTYSNLTGTGALDAGSITTNFGNINIGTSVFTGNGSGLTAVNADTLDSIDSASFVRSDANDTITGLITTTRSGEQMQFQDTSATGSPYVGFYQGVTRRAYIQLVNGGTLRLASDQFSSQLDIGNGTNGLTYTDGTTWTVWHSGNDGAGSGLDADLLDGVSSGSFLRSDTNDSFSGTLSGAGSINITGTVTAASFTGSGAGLTGISADNANTLDGIDSTGFLRLASTGTVTAAQYFQSNLGTTSGTLSSPPLQVYSTSTNSAFMSFHRGGSYAVNMGLDSDNVLRIGGWSASANRFQLDMTGNLTLAGEVTAYSDSRLKDNIELVTDALGKIIALRGVTFTRNDQDDTERRHMGVIAQEVETVMPELVRTDSAGIKTVNYGAMAGAFIEAIKEQQSQIDELKAMVQKLLDK